MSHSCTTTVIASLLSSLLFMFFEIFEFTYCLLGTDTTNQSKKIRHNRLVNETCARGQRTKKHFLPGNFYFSKYYCRLQSCSGL